MDKTKMRGVDLLTSLLLVLFAIWGLFETLKMPMTETYGAVKNVWYVSPALLPFIVNGGILVLGVFLFYLSLRQNGLQILKNSFSERVGRKIGGLSEKTQKFLVILLYLCSLAYVLVPSVDFYLSLSLFLLVFTASFYFEDMSLLRKLGYAFFGLSAFLIVLRVSGLMALGNEAFYYTTDILVLVFMTAVIAGLARYVKAGTETRKKWRRLLLVSFLSPFILIVIFKYFLLMPMPTEGGIIDLMNLVYFSF